MYVKEASPPTAKLAFNDRSVFGSISRYPLIASDGIDASGYCA